MASTKALEDSVEPIVINDQKTVTCPAASGAIDADSLSRVVKMALDGDEVATVEAGYELFRTYRLAVGVGPELEHSAAHQAALLTIVNIARRSMLGGVTVVGGLDVPLRVALPGHSNLGEAVIGLGGRIGSQLPDAVPQLVLGDSDSEEFENPSALRVTFQDWRGGVIPIADGRRLDESNAIIPAAVLAAAIGASEVFQQVRGNPMAGRRAIGLSLWNPKDVAWETAAPGPSQLVLPSRLWLIGLGHLGQAYLWTLGLLPYRSPDEVELVLQDFDRLTLANDSTSLLTTPSLVGRKKTRAMASWAESRGFETRLVERLFPGGIKVAVGEPRLALGGVDNAEARAAYEEAGFEHVIEAGLGAGPTEYLSLRMHTFPASTTPRKKWGGMLAEGNDTVRQSRAYEQLASEGTDGCGLVQLASRTVGAPFVGATAATLVIAEVLRRLNGGTSLEVVDLTLRDPGLRSVAVSARSSQRFNPGFTSAE